LIWLELRRWIERGEDGALVTVVRTAGSAYQREGTKMLFGTSGAAVGTISGGCLEADLYEHCRAAIARDEAEIVSYSAGGMMDSVFGVGTGCLGTIDVLVELLSHWRTASGHALLGEITARVEERVPFVVVTLLPTTARSAIVERWMVERRGTSARTVERDVASELAELAVAALEAETRRPSRNVTFEIGRASCRERV